MPGRSLPRVSEMPLALKIGQLFVVGFEGTKVSRALRRFLEEQGLGGVTLFARNVKGVRQVRQLCAEISRVNSPVPPLISIDQEGGPVMRLRVPPFTPWPAAGDVARYVERTGDLAAATAVGLAMGRELRAVGIHWNFAPVLDLDTNPRNPVIGPRAYGRRAGSAARLALAVERGLRRAGILTTGKHFPGHGDTVDDSHFSLPVVKRSARSLAAVELAPFRAAVRAGMPSLMTAHVLYPAWDRKRAASFSPAILQGILRGRLGYRGAIVSDDLSMAGARQGQTIEEAAFNSIMAGADILLVCHDARAQRRAYRHLLSRAEKGEIPMRRIDEAVRRILALKRRFIVARAAGRAPISWVGRPAHRRLVARIMKQGK
ncbi:MAG: beta-N-acetylhexosaminidase [Deltaproteobacteria bacterium]|nr:beta-N-acetylhexosaminidase [Deltaproteobacteria bacterium]